MILYVVSKLLGESLWSAVGLRQFRGIRGARLASAALRYGIVRLAMGRVLMVPLETLFAGKPEFPVYAGVVLPLRVLAWSALGAVIATHEVSVRPLVTSGRPLLLWILGACVVSTAADLSALLKGFWVVQCWP